MLRCPDMVVSSGVKMIESGVDYGGRASRVSLVIGKLDLSWCASERRLDRGLLRDEVFDRPGMVIVYSNWASDVDGRRSWMQANGSSELDSTMSDVVLWRCRLKVRGSRVWSVFWMCHRGPPWLRGNRHCVGRCRGESQFGVVSSMKLARGGI